MSYKLINKALLLANESSPQEEIGIERQDVDGNVYKYIKANEGLVIGQAVVPVVEAAWDSAVTNGAVASGDLTMSVDTKTGAVTANQFKGYFIGQAAAPLKGMFYKIGSHEAAEATDPFKLTPDRAFAEEFSDGVALRVYAPWLVEKVDAETEITLGIVLGTITADYYGWIQVGGFCRAVLIGHTTSNALVVNEPMRPIGTDLQGSLEGSSASVAAEETAAGAVIALQTVSSDTVGYVPALIKRFA